MSNKLKGVWIDGALWECEELSLLEKHFLQKIKDLDNNEGCFAMNSYFSEFFGISKGRCTQVISKLEEKGMIEKRLERKGHLVTKRVLRILNKSVKFFKQGVKEIKLGVKDSKQTSLENDVYNNLVLNNRIKNLVKREKEALSQIEKLESDLEKAKAEILELKIEKEKQRKKVALKKESSESYEGLSNFEIMDKRKENRTWTQLDTNFNGGFKMPKEWSDNLKNEVLGHWIYMDEKKGDRWGTTRTLSAQKDLITEWQNEFTEIEIINALLDCQQRGNVTPNPLWTKNRKIKEDEQKKQSQPIDDGLTFTERAMQQKFGSSMPNNQYEEGNSVVDTEWYEQ